MTIDEGKILVAKLVRTEAQKDTIELSGFTWFSPTPPTKWEAEVKATNSRTAYQEFTPEHLTDYESNPQMKMQVHQKIMSIIVQLTPK